MYASHASYSACGLASDGTDLLVEMVRERGPAAGLYGAKITGGGSGGTVAVLATAGSARSSTQSRDATTGDRPRRRVFAGSSSGARAFGVHTLDP